MSPVSDEEFEEWREQERSGAWTATPGDTLADCTFRPSGFRTYRLDAPDGRWSLVLSRLDLGEREPKGLMTVLAPGHDAAFGDLDGHVAARQVAVFGGRHLDDLARALVGRLGESQDDWSRRLDYLVARSVRAVQGLAGAGLAVDGEVVRPGSVRYVFEGRLRHGRTVSLFGPGSSGKTTIAGGLVVSLTSGTTIVPGWIPTGRYRVGVLDWDEGEEEELIRLYAITRGHGVSVEGYRYLRLSRPLTDCADEVGRWVSDERVEVLVVSPMNRALRPAWGDPGAPVFELYEVLREFGTSNILIDHVVGAQIGSKGAAREYGSVAKRDAVRGSYSLHEQSSVAGSRVVVLRNTKPDALAPRRPPEAIRIDFDPAFPPLDGVYERITFSADEVTGEEPGEPRAVHETQPDKLVRLLREHGPMSTTDLCVRGGFHAKNLREIARKARVKGFHVNHDGVTARWVLDLPVDSSDQAEAA